jgi:carbonic anhydrase
VTVSLLQDFFYNKEKEETAIKATHTLQNMSKEENNGLSMHKRKYTLKETLPINTHKVKESFSYYILYNIKIYIHITRI